MRLLVSVRNQTEARAALSGGADVVDAKEPHAGALGQVDGDALTAIRAAVPRATPLSAALGDVATGDDVARACARVAVPLAFVKFGFAGVAQPERIGALLAAAVAEAARLPGAPGVIAVAYADWGRAGTVAPLELLHLARAAGAAGILVDTAGKDGLNLRAWCSRDDLCGVALEAGRRGLRLGLAGSLGPSDVAWAARTGAELIGVRGAACRGGRAGPVDPRLVRRLAAQVRQEPGPGPRGRSPALVRR